MKNRVKHRARKGATIVEASLVLGLTLFTIMGLIELAIALFFYQGVIERARAGARWAVVHGYDETQFKNMVVYGNAAGSGGSVLGLDPAMVDVCVDPIDQTSASSVIHMRVTRPTFKLISPFFGGYSMQPSMEVSLPVEAAGCSGSAAPPTCPVTLPDTCP